MPETNISYNGITLRDVLTESIDQQLVKEPTGVDPLYVKVHVSVTTLFHMSNVDGLGLNLGSAGTLASGYNQVIERLMQPRRHFEMTVGDGVLFDVAAGHTRPGIHSQGAGRLPQNQLDVNHGPVTTVKVLDIVSAQSMRIQFGITMCLPYCSEPGQQPGGVISFRFWIAEDIDCADWTTTRVYHGRIRVADLSKNVLLELRRNYRFPALQRAFKRRKITLNQSTDGLELEFSITDQEQWAVAPAPATEWSGYHSITSPEPGGAVLTSSIHVRLKAPNNVPKRALMQLAQKIMIAKLHYEDLRRLKQSWLQYASYKEIFEKNEVEANATVKLIGDDADIKLWNVADLNNTFGLPLDDGAVRLAGYDHTKAVIGSQTATLKGLFLAFLNDPCHVFGFPGDSPSSQGKETQRSNASVEVVDQGEELQASDSGYSDEHMASAYNVYKMSSDITTDLGVIQMPLGLRKVPTDPSVAFISLHQGVTERVIRIDAERLEAWPTLPEPKDFVDTTSKINHSLLSEKIYPSAPLLSADGRKTLYHVRYELRFGLSRRPDYSKGEIPAALLPYRKSKDGESDIFVIPATAFKSASGILTEGVKAET
ncbi:MAG: hypothetical protein CL480_11380 [Acidobacteria bacterium]|nr:hypothetical protein [Acidobacteriota bacterium]|tara:strand:- start:2393 stop:4183 length:1791 start_codon:yes stop_codon:yes gene_type:complete